MRFSCCLKLFLIGKLAVSNAIWQNKAAETFSYKREKRKNRRKEAENVVTIKVNDGVNMKKRIRKHKGLLERRLSKKTISYVYI